MYQLKKIPLLRLLFPFILGLALAIYSTLSVFLTLGFVASLSLLLSYFFTKDKQALYANRWFTGALVAIFLFVLGFVYTKLSNSQGPLLYKPGQNAWYKAQIKASPLRKGKNWQLKAALNPLQSAENTMALLYVDTQALAWPLKIGDSFLVKLRLQALPKPQNPYQFDYGKYLSYKAIYYTAFVKASDMANYKINKQFSVFQFAFQTRKAIVKQFKHFGFTGNELAIASALIIGDTEELSPELRSAYAANGAMHVLAVSGLHVGIVYLLLQFLLGFIPGFKNNKIAIPLCCILLLWMYAGVTGLSPSVCRATTMFSLLAVSKMRRIEVSIFNVLAASVFILVLYNPYMLTEVGFQLSYLAVLGIVILQKPLVKMLTIKNRFLYKIWEITTVSLAAQLSTAVLSLVYFHQFPTYFLIANLLVIPAAFGIVVLGFSFVVFSWMPPIQFLLAKVLMLCIQLLNALMFHTENLPFAVLRNVFISDFEAWLAYLVLAFAILAILKMRFYALSACLVSAIAMLVFSLTEAVNENTNGMYVYALNNETAIAFIDAKTRLLISSNTNRAKLDFHIGKHSAKLKIDTVCSWNDLLQRPTPFVKILPDSNVVIFHKNKSILYCSTQPSQTLYKNCAFSAVILDYKAPFKQTELPFSGKLLAGGKYKSKHADSLGVSSSYFALNE